MNLAIVGSRRLEGNPEAYRIVREVIDDHLADPDCVPLVIISGAAQGVDQMAARAALLRGAQRLPSVEALDGLRLHQGRIWLLELPPLCRGTGRRPPPGHRCTFRACFAQRNREIASVCNKLVAVIGAASVTYGTGWTRDRARELGRIVEEIRIP